LTKKPKKVRISFPDEKKLVLLTQINFIDNPKCESLFDPINYTLNNKVRNNDSLRPRLKIIFNPNMNMEEDHWKRSESIFISYYPETPEILN
jgi:hypothetical protein